MTLTTKHLRELCERATVAWRQIDAACSGLLASQCKRHAPYMGCPMDCNDIANALDPELLNARPLLDEALSTLPTLLDANDALTDEVERLRGLLRRACDIARQLAQRADFAEGVLADVAAIAQDGGVE